jgi:hypothetical protein
MLQLVVPNDEGTAHVSATFELKPPIGAIVRLSVIAVPLGIDTTGLATVSVKSEATTVTFTGICRMCVNEPLVAVMVIDPVVADDEAFTVSVLVTPVVELTVTGFVPSEQVSPVVPEQLKLTLPVNPCTGVTVIVSVVEPPALTLSVLFPAVMVKSAGTPVTLTGICNTWVTLPPNHVPTAVIETEPLTAVVEAFTVSDTFDGEPLCTDTVAGFTEQVSPVVPAHEKLTVIASPFTRLTESVSVVDPPKATVSVLLPDES